MKLAVIKIKTEKPPGDKWTAFRQRSCAVFENETL